MMKLLLIICIWNLLAVCLASQRLGTSYQLSSRKRLWLNHTEVVAETESYYVYHIEKDIANDDKLIFSEGHCIKTTNGLQSTVLAGSAGSSGYINAVGTSARFSSVTGFTQKNRTHVLIVDHSNYCLRVVDRTTAIVSDYVGQCRSAGNYDGFGTTARFYRPYSVIEDKRRAGHYFVSDWYTHAIRYIDTENRYVSTVISSPLLIPNPSGIVRESANTLLIVVDSGIRRLFLDTSMVTFVTGNTTDGYADGTLQQAIYNDPRAVIFLTRPALFLMADTDNSRLRLIDLQKNTVSSLCQGYSSSGGAGTASSCVMNYPRGLTKIGNDIYVAARSRIHKLPITLAVENDGECTPASSVTSSTEQCECPENPCCPPGNLK